MKRKRAGADRDLICSGPWWWLGLCCCLVLEHAFSAILYLENALQAVRFRVNDSISTAMRSRRERARRTKKPRRRLGFLILYLNWVNILEAPPGIEPGMKVLQTSALPLGYGANFGAGDGARTRHLRLGKAALYQMSYSRSGASEWT